MGSNIQRIYFNMTRGQQLQQEAIDKVEELNFNSMQAHEFTSMQMLISALFDYLDEISTDLKHE